MLKKNTLCKKVFFILSLFFVVSVSAVAERHKRPMTIHKVEEVGLEIWTEYEPRWETGVMYQGKIPVFIAHTPYLTYPSAGMSWVNHKEMVLTNGEFVEVAKTALVTAAKNYKVEQHLLGSLKINPQSYGQLIGYEADFVGLMEDKEVDVKVFIGRFDNKGPVTIQVYTSVGKMAHLKEQVRRSWTHTRYLGVE